MWPFFSSKPAALHEGLGPWEWMLEKTGGQGRSGARAQLGASGSGNEVPCFFSQGGEAHTKHRKTLAHKKCPFPLVVMAALPL